jgi:uncharacterized protein (DUF305 family)
MEEIMTYLSARMRWLLVFIAVLALLLAACGDGDADDSDAGNDAGITEATKAGSTSPASEPTATSGMGHDMRGTPMAGAEMDLMFIDSMIPHHQSAIDMAEIAREQGEHAEIRQLADEIIAAQQAEIDQMLAWREEWFPGAEQSGGMPGMGDMAGMSMSEADIQALRDADPFDQAFIDGMIPHHESAVMMAQEILKTTDRPEIRQLAEEIIAAQETEIEQMRQWRAEWFGE